MLKTVSFAAVARTDAANTFTGVQTFSGPTVQNGAYSSFSPTGGGTSTTSVYISSAGRESFVLTSSSAVDTIAHIANTGVGGSDWQIRSTANGSAFVGGALVFYNAGAKSIIFANASGVASATLLSSGNLSTIGTISPQQATTAAAPAYVKGAIYFDTTLNKLRVGGATAWETITSV